MFGCINWIQSSLPIHRLVRRSTWKLRECFSVFTKPFLGLMRRSHISQQQQLAGPLWPSIESSRGTVLPNLHVDPVWSPKIAQIMLQPKLKLARKKNPSNPIANKTLMFKSLLVLPALLNIDFTIFGTTKCKAESQIDKFSYQLGKGMFVYQKHKRKKRYREPSRIPKVKLSRSLFHRKKRKAYKLLLKKCSQIIRFKYFI